MRYQGSEAYSMEATERRRERLERQAAPSFEVVTGGGLVPPPPGGRAARLPCGGWRGGPPRAARGGRGVPREN